MRLPCRDPKEVWDGMKSTAEGIKQAKVDYDLIPIYQNSNSVIRAVLERNRIDTQTVLPDGITEENVPGFGNDLSDPYDRIDKLFGSSSSQGTEGSSAPQPDEPDTGGDDDDGQDVAGGGGEEGESLRPEVRRFLDDLKQPVDPVSEIMLKDQRDWTEDELARVQGSDLYQSPSSPRRDEAYGKVRDWYVHHYGDGPAGRDETGRLVPPEYRVTPKQAPVVARSGDGRPLLDGVMEAGAKIADMADKRGLATAVRGVQAGLNLLNRQGSDGGRKTRLLKPDGTFGPKTKQALQDSVMEQGSQKVENALAMGTFRNLMDNKRGQARGGLAEAAHDSFQPLFEKPTSHRPDDRAPTPWGMVLQDTINDAGTETFGDGFEAVRADGWIGPKTVKAFDAVYRPTGADGFMKKLADNFGFF